MRRPAGDLRFRASRDVAPRTAETYRWSLGILRTDVGTQRVRKLTADANEANFLRHHGLGVGAADDLAQDVWLATLKNLARLEEPDRFAPWRFTIARRTVTDQLRRRYRRPPGPVPPEGSTEAVDDDFTIDLVSRAITDEALAALDQRDRLVVCLHYLNDLSVEDNG